MMPNRKLRLGVPVAAVLACAAAMGGCTSGAPVDAAAGVVVPCPGTSDPPPAGLPCGLVCRAALPIRASNSRLFLVDIAVNDKPALMLLDTGASQTVFSPAAAARLGLPAATLLDTDRMVGGGGEIPVRATSVRSIAFGQVRLGPGRVYLLPELQTAAGSGELGYDGMLGNDVLGRYQLDLDFSHQTVRLYDGKLCTGALPNWPAEASVVPMTSRFGPNLVTVTGVLDGLPVTTVLDTGWEAIDVGAATARKLNVGPEQSKADRLLRVYGIGPNVVTERLHRFKALQIGAMTLPDPDIAISPEQFEQSMMLVGDPVLSTRRVWIDYPGRQVHFGRPD